MYGRSLGTRGATSRAAAEAENGLKGRVRGWERKTIPNPLAPHVVIPMWVRGEKQAKPLSPTTKVPSPLPRDKQFTTPQPKPHFDSEDTIHKDDTNDANMVTPEKQQEPNEEHIKMDVDEQQQRNKSPEAQQDKEDVQMQTENDEADDDEIHKSHDSTPDNADPLVAAATPEDGTEPSNTENEGDTEMQADEDTPGGEQDKSSPEESVPAQGIRVEQDDADIDSDVHESNPISNSGDNELAESARETDITEELAKAAAATGEELGALPNAVNTMDEVPLPIVDNGLGESGVDALVGSSGEEGEVGEIDSTMDALDTEPGDVGELVVPGDSAPAPQPLASDSQGPPLPPKHAEQPQLRDGHVQHVSQENEQSPHGDSIER